jgi:inositol-pentakisphosphate 2-kinase
MLSSLANDGALKALKRAQEENDQVGPLKAGKKDYKFALAMTLRDCSCFAQVERRSLLDEKNIIPLKVRISDLDMKSLKYKLEYWRKTEEELIDQGFYTADWVLIGSEYYHPPTSCSLEWSIDRRHRKPDIVHVRDKERSGDMQPAGLRKALAALEQESMVFHLDGNTQLLQKCLEPFKKDVTVQKRPEIACINPERSRPM